MDLLNQSCIKSITIKKAPKIVKFKASTGAHLYTLVLSDLDKAHKLESNIKRNFSLILLHVVRVSHWPISSLSLFFTRVLRLCRFECQGERDCLNLRNVSSLINKFIYLPILCHCRTLCVSPRQPVVASTRIRSLLPKFSL